MQLKTTEYKSPLKMPGGSERRLCYWPFRLDPYGCGCTNNCSYCYARSVLSFRGLWDQADPRIADMDKVERTLERGVSGKLNGELGGLLNPLEMHTCN